MERTFPVGSLRSLPVPVTDRYLPRQFGHGSPAEDESTVDTDNREEVDEMKLHRFEPDNGTGHPGSVLLGYPRAEVETRRDLAWCFDYDRTDDVPEMHRKDGYIYVPADEWDRRVTGNND